MRLPLLFSEQENLYGSDDGPSMDNGKWKFIKKYTIGIKLSTLHI